MIKHRWIMVSGTGPGVGKSTLAAGLARQLATHVSVDLIPEEDLFVRPEFAEAGSGFRHRRYESMSDDLLVAYDRVRQKAQRESSAVIFDWEAAGMVEDLPCAEDQAALYKHVQSVMDLVRHFHPVVLCLEAPLRLAFDRAAAERGEPWLTRFAALGADQGLAPNASTEDRAFAYLESNQGWRPRTDAAYVAAGWPMVEIDASRPSEAVLADALAVVSGEGLTQVLE